MTAGISTASLFLRLNTEDALPLFHEWNIPEAEVFLSTFCEYEPAFAKKLAQGKGNVSVNSVHVLGTQFEPQLYSAHPRVREDAYGWLKKAMTAAQILGAKYYTFHGIARIKRTFREDFARVGELTAQIAAFCKRFGVTLSYENVEWSFYNRVGVFRELKKHCPALKGVLDIKQARRAGEPYEKFLEEMGEDLTHVHVSDLDENGKMCLPGTGVFDFDRLFSALREIGFRGAVLIENYGNDYKDLGRLRTAYEFLAEKAYRYTAP